MTTISNLKLSAIFEKALCMGLMSCVVMGTSAFAQQASAPPTSPPEAAAPAVPAPVPTPPATTEVAPVAPPAAVATPPAPASTLAILNEIAPPPEGKANIVFYRPAKYVGMALRFSVRDGDTGIGKLQNGSYFVHVAEPGAREYNIASEARDTLRLEVEAGETYYVVQSISMGLVVGRPNLTPSDDAAFQAKKLKVTTLTATDR